MQAAPQIHLPRQSEWRVAKPSQRVPAKGEGLVEPGTEAFPVRVIIFQDQIETGWDEGALGFEESAVWFSGKACSFRIVAADLRSEAADVLKKGLLLRHPTREIRVQIHMLVVEDRKEWEDEASLVAKLDQLPKNPSEESQYPPLTPRPGLLPRPHRWIRFRPFLALLGFPLQFVVWEGSPWIETAAKVLGAAFLILFILTAENPNVAKLRKILLEESKT